MDDSPSVIFSLEAENAITGWLKTTKPTLIARCLEHKTELYVVTDMSAKPELGNYQEYTVNLRFDEEKPRSEMWSESTDNKALFAGRAIPLMRRIAKAKTMRVRFTPFNASPQTITFDVRGFDAHLPLIAKTCGWKP
jgi:hypothetical protein